MKIISSIKTKAFLLLIITMFASFTLNIKIKKVNNKNHGFFSWLTDKVQAGLLNQMKGLFESKFDINKNQKTTKCWNYLWEEGIKSNPGLWSTIKTMLGSLYNMLMGSYSKADLNNDLLSLFSKVPDEEVSVEGGKLKCKQILNGIVSGNDDDQDKKPKLDDTNKSDPNLNTKGPGFVTSAASVNRDVSFRNPNMFKILNSQ